MDIRNSVVLVTSAGTALGCTLATHFLSLGAQVVVADTDSHALLETIRRCRNLVDKVNYFHLSSHSVSSINALFDYIEENFRQSPDVLVNYWPSQPLPALFCEKTGSDEFANGLATFASPLYSFGQVSAQRMRRHGTQGVIVNLSNSKSDDTTDGLENVHGLITGMTQSWAKELGPFRIRVGGVIPVHFHEPDSDHGHWAQLQDELIRNTEYIITNDYFNGRVVSAEV